MDRAVSHAVQSGGGKLTVSKPTGTRFFYPIFLDVERVDSLAPNSTAALLLFLATW